LDPFSWHFPLATRHSFDFGWTGEGASEEEELAPATQSMLYVKVPGDRKNDNNENYLLYY
jgi:hypothetical protein